MTIQVSINDQQNVELPVNASLQEALIFSGHTQGCFAVAVNKTFVSKGCYPDLVLQEGDIIEILAPMQGG